MAIHYRTQAIIINKEDRGDADRMFTVFTKDFGKLRVHAVSERKITSKLRGGLELFYVSDIEFIRGKARKTLTDALCIQMRANIRGDLRRARIAYRISGILDEIVKGEEADEKIWYLLDQVFSFLDRKELNGDDLRLVSYYFLWNIFELTGYMPELAQLENGSPEIAAEIQGLVGKDIEDIQVLPNVRVRQGALKSISEQHLSKILEN